MCNLSTNGHFGHSEGLVNKEQVYGETWKMPAVY